ncbi:hypothetical protein BH20BAC1_BH20BAC1_06660 [soil metagenome]
MFIAVCAVALAAETNLLLGLPLNNSSFYIFIFGATLAQYNLHYLVKKTAVPGSLRLKWSLVNKNIHRILFLLGCGCILFSLFQFQLRHFYILSILGAIAVVYSYPAIPFISKKRIKDYGLLKIFTLALFWTLVTVWFPVSDMITDKINYALVFSMRFIFIFVLCLLFDIRDIAIDSQEGINTLPVLLGKENSYRLALILLIGFCILAIVQFIYTKNYFFVLIMVISAISTAGIMQLSRKMDSDVMYLAGIDGMMLLQAVLVIVVR